MHHIPRCVGMCEERAFSFQKHYISLKCEVTLQRSQSCPALPRECGELGDSAHLLMGLGSQQRLVSLGSILDFGGSSGCLFSAMISEQ